ncbi:MAG: TlpA family protein disulfide reductase [Granulosicoccus sp.]|nr:TlpA family protein disulfide reductase [Granulosicoccus sp.]
MLWFPLIKPSQRLIRCSFLTSLAFLPFNAFAEIAPDFSLPGDQSEIRLSAYQGDVVYVDFWASWCGPCRDSFPFMNELHDQYAEGGLKVIAINLDREISAAQAFIHDPESPGHDPRFTIAYNSGGEVAEAYNVRGMPSSYVIDRDGNIAYSHLGFNRKDRAEIEARIKYLLRSNNATGEPLIAAAEAE